MAVGEGPIREMGVAPSDWSKTATPVFWGLVERRRLKSLGKYCCDHKSDHSVDGCHRQRCDLFKRGAGRQPDRRATKPTLLMKTSLSLIPLLTTTTLACAQGSRLQ